MNLTEAIIQSIRDALISQHDPTLTNGSAYKVGINIPPTAGANTSLHSNGGSHVITVLRTGGSGNRFHENAIYTVDIMAPTQLECDRVGKTVRETLLNLELVNGIGRVTITGEAQMPKPYGSTIQPCYRINASITHHV